MNLYSTMNQFISKTPRLRHILKFDRRIESDLQQEALELIQRRYPAPEFGGEGEPSVDDGNVVVDNEGDEEAREKAGDEGDAEII